jgi:hypothetical protein
MINPRVEAFKAKWARGKSHRISRLRGDFFAFDCTVIVADWI